MACPDGTCPVVGEAAEACEAVKVPFHVPIHKKLGTGAVAGIIGTSCIFPIDCVKTRLQIVDPHTGLKMYHGPLDALKGVIHKDGIRGLYRGLLPNLIGVTPEKAIKLAVNELLREVLGEDAFGRLELKREILAGAGAGAAQVIATCPMEISKIRMQTMSTLPAEQHQSLVQVVRQLGIRGMYRGSFATFLRDVPFSVIMFPAYANMKRLLAGKNKEPSFLNILFSGCFCSALGSGLVTPMDVVKTRLQAKGGNKRYASVGDCFKRVYKEEGARAFFHGCVPRMATIAPLFGISLAAFEIQKRILIRRHEK